MKKPLKIQLLGNFHLTFNDLPIPGVESPRLQSFLAYLLIHQNTPLQRQQIAYLFWPDSNESQARTNLRNMLYRLREALPDADEYLEIGSQTLWWKPESPFQLDLIEFEEAAAYTDVTGSGKDQQAHHLALKAAVDAYTGDLLPSCYDDWIFPERERLNQAWLRILEELIDIIELDQNYAEAIRYTQLLLRGDPLHEDSYRRLMNLHALNGDKARAVRSYHRCVDMLEKELGLDPSPSTSALYQELMDREDLDGKPARVSEKGSQMVGRGLAWKNLHKAWSETKNGTRMALILGEAGIGKTYLAEEFTRWARREGIKTLVNHSYPGERELAYTPLTKILRSDPIKSKLNTLEVTWLVELSRLIPELEIDFPALPEPDQLAENWQRQRMFEASARALLSGENKCILVMDDLQWCDRETLDWLCYLLEFKTQTRLLVLVGVRTEDLTSDSLLLPIFSELERSGRITEILLDRLNLDSTRSLAADLWGDVLEDAQAEQLFLETEGNPLFVAEMVRAGFLKDELGARRLPPKVQAVIETRLNALSEIARGIATIAAVVGREFGFDLLLQAGEGKDEDLLLGLDELWGRRLIQDVGEEGYNFSHDKFREVIYQDLSPHRRKYYHQKVADALVKIHSENLEEYAPQLASHYKQAGKEDLAVDYYLLGGDQARVLYARHNAIDNYQRAAALLGNRKDPRLIKIFQGWGDVLIKLTLYDEFSAAYKKMLTTSTGLGDCQSQAKAWLAIGTVWDRQGDHSRALECAEKALTLAEDNDCQIEMAEAVLLKGQSCYRMGNVEEAGVFIKEALDRCHKGADLFTQSRCLSLMGLIQDDLGEFDQAREYKEEALAVTEKIEGNGIKGWRGTIYMNLANTANLRGSFREAVDLYQKSLDIFHETKNQDMVIPCLVNMSAAKSGLGDYQQAEKDLRKVLDLTSNYEWMGKSIANFLLAEACLSQGKMEEAYQAALVALEHAENTGAQQALGAACRVLGKAASTLKREIELDGKLHTPRACFQHSEQIYADLGADAERAHTLKAWAEHERENGNKKEADSMWEEAKAIFQRLEMGAEVEMMECSE